MSRVGPGTPLLQRVIESQQSILGAGEHFEAAARARTVPGTPTSDQLPPAMIWAVTSRRLLIWELPRRGDLGRVVTSLDIGPVVNRATIQGYEGNDVALTVFAGEHPAVVIMALDDARAIAQCIDRIVHAAVPPPPIPPPPVVPEAELDPVDPTRGDPVLTACWAALRAGDWEALEAADASAEPALREVLLTTVQGDDAITTLDAWAAARPDLAAPYALRGAARVNWAFAGQRTSGPPTADADVFHARLRAAETDLWRAVDLDPGEPTVWTPLITSARGLQIGSEELCMRFDESVRRLPGLFRAHVETLIGLSRRWAGSHAALFAFADALARPAPEGSPLHALVPYAHLLRSVDNAGDDPRRRYFSSDVEREIRSFAIVSVESDAWSDDASTVEACNVFALARFLCGDEDGARRLWERIGDRRTEDPWREHPESSRVLDELDELDGPESAPLPSGA